MNLVPRSYVQGQRTSAPNWRAVRDWAARVFLFFVLLAMLWDIVVDASITAWVLGWLI